MSDLKITHNSNSSARFVIGIDLGTTNCALAYVDMLEKSTELKMLQIPQWESADAVHATDTLPSFYYLPSKNEWKKGQLNLPFVGSSPSGEAQDYVVGRYARSQASVQYGRVVHSAKSWLCHLGVDRSAPILPWHSDDVVGSARRSPIEVSAAYLDHLAKAWNACFATDSQAYKIDRQDVIITVPASFDEVAQELTLAAAEKAGLDGSRVRLLEEPQAAFYFWLSTHARDAEGCAKALKALLPALTSVSQSVLICDIGGGTTDLSLFEIEPLKGIKAYPVIRRIAVSDHLLLGGDNIDMALAYILERRMTSGEKRLPSRQWAQLISQARLLKEKALGTSKDEDDSCALHASIVAEGAGLFSSTISASVSVQEIKDMVVSDYLPLCERHERPHRKSAGLLELGLPYAEDSAITRHLASFLSGRTVDAIMFTGGTLKPKFMRDQILKVLNHWQSKEPVILENEQMDLAVALGAAHYASLQRSPERRITGGYPRSLYAEVSAEHIHPRQRKAICILAKGAEPGNTVVIDQIELMSLAGEPIRFQLYTSANRPEDCVGDLVEVNVAHFHPLPPLDTKLVSQKGGSEKIKVHLEAQLTETGILELYCVHEAQRWRLAFNLRGIKSSVPFDADVSEHVHQRGPDEQAHLRQIRVWLDQLYGSKKRDDLDVQPKRLVRRMEELTGKAREEIDISLLRELWPNLKKGLTRRNRSVAHEVIWLSVSGLCLRPGYGFPLDEWRVADLWRCYELGRAHPQERQVEEQWWIMWRRVAGGLERWQQEKIFDKLFPSVRKGDAVSVEAYLLMGSLERVGIEKKIKLGNAFIQQLRSGKKQYASEKLWALARLASRTPLYCGPEAIIRPEIVERWLKDLREFNVNDKFYKRLPLVFAQAGRIVNDREFDVSEPIRAELIERMQSCGSSEAWLAPLRQFMPLDREARDRLFGETLPSGLFIE